MSYLRDIREYWLNDATVSNVHKYRTSIQFNICPVDLH
jgi:hypothetical protein